MSQIDRIVQVDITRETQQIDIAAFDIPLILVKVDTSAIPMQRVETFTSLNAVSDLFGTSHVAYTMSQKLLSGDIKPAEFKIGYVEAAAVGAETYAEGLQEVLNADDTWYALLSDTRAESDVEAMAAIIQANRRMFFTSSSDTDIVSTLSTTDIGSKLHDLGYFRTALMYSPTADTEYPEASWVGSQIVEIPGSNTWEYKRLVGVTLANLTDSQITALESKGVNYYIRVKGAPITRKGVSADESWIDEIIFVDWLQARIQEQVYFRLINKKKIPYTRAGFTLIENEIRSVLAQGVQNGGIADDTPYIVISPDPLAIPQMTRTARIADGFRFEARLAGAVSKVIIRGNVYA